MQLFPATNFQESFGSKKSSLFTIHNSNGMTAQITNYGATLVSLWVKNALGKENDVVLGYERLSDYRKMTNPYFGRTIGRYGNRISSSQFTIDNKVFTLEKNDGHHNLHAGSDAFHTAIWDLVEHTANTLTLSYLSPHLEGGFPGNLAVSVIFKITEENALDISYKATTDATTHVNLTHHSYFNLNLDKTEPIDNHLLQIHGRSYLPIDKECIPTDYIEAVSNTPFDFRNFKKIGQDINATHQQVILAGGYDHNFILDGKDMRVVAQVSSPSSGITMTVTTDEPGLQFYSGNHISSTPVGKYNETYIDRGGFCLETQHFPDSPNRADFPSTLLEAGSLYTSKCTFTFSITK
ncbi:aldose epimerase family protein [Dokdonia sp. PRO95]|uniref:aldose epimerase family protein n=1 Tax=Dokdonia sp. PRO95 TaxID=1239415 RepID=UPI000B225A08|nr:aldose epimerase family protein [Dokdonia sp. PRO95]